MAVSLEHAMTEIKRHFTPEGFSVEKDKTRLWVDLIEQANGRELFQDYPQYGLALFSPKEDDSSEEAIALPEEEFYAGKGAVVLAIGYSPELKEVIHSEGIITDVDDSEEVATFTVQLESHFSSKLYTVFLINKIHSALNFLGIFSFSLGKVVHIAGFEEKTRGHHIFVTSQCGQFNGAEEGNRGPGPRSISISHSKLSGKSLYSLKFIHGRKKCNPHSDSIYNQNNQNKEKLYQTALDTFIDQYKARGTIPKKFSFSCYKKKSEYEAVLEE
ncbi:MAG: hypothetical protein Q8L98_05275 [Chlamydiales bacterium]|nr:hypothetical protein [Chlamydiales bacterium]